MYSMPYKDKNRKTQEQLLLEQQKKRAAEPISIGALMSTRRMITKFQWKKQKLDLCKRCMKEKVLKCTCPSLKRKKDGYESIYQKDIKCFCPIEEVKEEKYKSQGIQTDKIKDSDESTSESEEEIDEIPEEPKSDSEEEEEEKEAEGDLEMEEEDELKEELACPVHFKLLTLEQIRDKINFETREFDFNVDDEQVKEEKYQEARLFLTQQKDATKIEQKRIKLKYGYSTESNDYKNLANLINTKGNCLLSLGIIFNYSRSLTEYETFESIMKACVKCECLRTLELKLFRIIHATNDWCEAIGQLLKGNQFLRSLWISLICSKNITDKGFMLILYEIKRLKYLQQLSLFLNETGIKKKKTSRFLQKLLNSTKYLEKFSLTSDKLQITTPLADKEHYWEDSSMSQLDTYEFQRKEMAFINT